MQTGKLTAVFVGRPTVIQVEGRRDVTTAIFKKPVAGRVKVGATNLEGDAQADLAVHGGWSKAVYAYPSEHYGFWRRELPDTKLGDSQFGENLATEGLLETEVFIGDIIRIGTAEFVVTEPRMPCYKLGIAFGRSDIVRRFLESRRSGIYLAVLKTGELGAGDEIDLISRDENQVTVSDIVRLYVEDKDDVETMKRAINVKALPESWKDRFRERIASG